MNELALFAGAGGGMLGGKLLGWRTVCAVERDAYPAAVLAQRQNDGTLPPFPIWSDIETFDGRPWRGIVDVISGGFPCQDISAAGKGAGITGERSGLWKEMWRVVCEVRPRYVFVENSPMLTSRGLGVVLGDLAKAGYDSKWMCLSAQDCGANHRRERIWILGNADNNGRPTTKISSGTGERSDSGETRQNKASESTRPSKQYAELAYPYGEYEKRIKFAKPSEKKPAKPFISGWWEAEPSVGRVANGVAFRRDRLKAIGNGQVPIVAATAWRILTEN